MTSMSAHTIRQNCAKQSVHSERDRLLKNAETRQKLQNYGQKFGPGDSKDRARALIIAIPMALGCMIPYVCMILLWFVVYYHSYVQTIVACASLFLTGALFCIGSAQRVLGRDRRWLWWFGLLWTQAVAAGLVVGFFLYFRHLAYYWKYEEMRTYTNVAAAQSASAFGDGSMFLFTEDSRLDAMRAVGYKSRWTGQTYCAAPVVDVTMSQASDIYFWAVGDDCCTSRADFFCDDAGDFTTRSALRVLEPEDVARPFMHWAVRGASYPKYMDAVRLQESTYFTKASSRPLLVRWTKDPIAFKDSFYSDARDACIKVSLVYFGLVVLAVYFIAWTLVPLQKQEAIFRDI